MKSSDIEKIREAAKAVNDLHAKQDEVYNQLIKDLNLGEYEARWALGSDPAEIKGKNPTSYLFDCVYNNSIVELEEQIEKLLKAKEQYESYFEKSV